MAISSAAIASSLFQVRRLRLTAPVRWWRVLLAHKGGVLLIANNPLTEAVPNHFGQGGDSIIRAQATRLSPAVLNRSLEQEHSKKCSFIVQMRKV